MKMRYILIYCYCSALLISISFLTGCPPQKPPVALIAATFEECGGYSGYAHNDVGFVATVVLEYDEANGELADEIQNNESKVRRMINDTIVSTLKRDTDYSLRWQEALPPLIKAGLNRRLVHGAISNVLLFEPVFLPVEELNP